MNNFTFDDPAWLGLLLLLPLAGWLQGASGAPPAVVYSSLKLVQRFSRIAPHRAGRFLATLRWLALIACILGMARPQWGEGRERIRASGIDIMLTLDLSDSMEAKDFRNEGRNVTRLDISKQVLKEFVEGFRKAEDYQRAIDDYTRAIELDPNDAYSYNNRGVAKRLFNLSPCDDYQKACELGLEVSCDNYFEICE